MWSNPLTPLPALCWGHCVQVSKLPLPGAGLVSMDTPPHLSPAALYTQASPSLLTVLAVWPVDGKPSDTTTGTPGA